MDFQYGTTRRIILFPPAESWDLQLDLIAKLAIPVVVVGATIAFGILQAHFAQQQHDTDQQRALDQQQATTLQTYIDNIQDLLLNHNLLKSKPADDIAILARARTLTALQELDPGRKGRLLIFLHEAELIGFDDGNGKTHDPIIDLSNADLSRADLSNADLGGADLRDAHLIGAQNLTQQQFDQVYTCKNAILPPGLICHHNQI